MTAAALLTTLSACGSSGSSTKAAGGECAPVKGDALVVLQDDKKLQQAENIIPAVNAGTATKSPTLLPVLNKVSSVLDTAKLIALNKQTDIERVTPKNAAKAFVDANKLTEGLEKGSGTIKVGTQGFSESQTMGEIYVAVLNAAGFTASTKTVGPRPTYAPALSKGSDVQVVPDYLGSLTEYFNKTDNGPTAPAKASGDVDKTLTALKELAAKHQVVVGEPAEAQDTNAFAVTKAFADKHKVKTLSELAKTCTGGVILGAPAECTSDQQPQCAPGLKATYGLKISKFVPSGSAGSAQVKTFAKTGRVALALVLSSDGTLQQS
ncbi:MAG: glycine betaine ABC transporter substrate-binding protein [Mycobacteriales bacterium]